MEFESRNVIADESAASELRSLGIRGLPVVRRGEKSIVVQVISDLAAFIGLEDDGGPQLSPEELVDRLDSVLAATTTTISQMPDSMFDRSLPDRPRSIRELAHHSIQILAAFLDADESQLGHERDPVVSGPPTHMRTPRQVAEFGHGVRGRARRWWVGASQEDFDAVVDTYFGEATRHVMLERAVWHSAQHCRQLVSLLQAEGIPPGRPLHDSELEGLPIPAAVWDSRAEETDP